MMNVSDEELYNIPTAEYVHRRGFINRNLTVYHVAVHACAELKSKEVYFKFYWKIVFFSIFVAICSCLLSPIFYVLR